MQLLDASAFSTCLKQMFQVHIGESRVGMVLETMQMLPVQNYPGICREPFVLFFRSPLQTILPQQTYVMENEKLGVLSIQISPSRLESNGMLYHAVFN